MDLPIFTLFGQADAAAAPLDLLASAQDFVSFATMHWRFCLLHFLEFAVWGAWFVVLGNMLNARGFSRSEIGRIYSTMPIGSMIAPLFMAVLADKYFNTEVLIAVSHLIGGVLLFMMARTSRAWPFFWIALFYAVLFSPTLSLVNSIVFAHDADIFGGKAEAGFPWIRVFGTLGWIAAGLSHTLILKKGEPVSARPMVLAGVLSLILGGFAFTLPATAPAGAAANGEVAAAAAEDGATEVAAAEQEADEATDEAAAEAPAAGQSIVTGSIEMLKNNPVFFGVTFIAAMAMGLYFAFAALFVEKSGISGRTVGPVMTIGQWIEIFFMLSLPWFLGADNKNMNFVLMAGISAWAARFLFFAIGRPLALILFGVAIHGICFDFFFAAGFINANSIAPVGLTATAQQLYGFLVYGLGMFLGSLGAGWLNEAFTSHTTDEEGNDVATTRWSLFWLVPAVIVGASAALFWFQLNQGG
ncbi:MAG: MFS transporter [Pirellulales bacterium]|nr:MFS transporter [Pirellulales bacterium]MBL7192757.1 MFS transporter [Pirellulales bacterium]